MSTLPAIFSATSPEHLARSLDAMRAWCTARIGECERDAAEAAELLELEQRGGVKLPPAVDRRRRLALKRVEFYRKVEAALAAGYYIVPNFPTENVAVRRKRGPGSKHSRYAHELNATAELLPLGDGGYVSPSPELESFTEPDPTPQDPKRVVRYFRATAYAQPECPIALVSTEVLEAAQRALRERIFDELGYCRDEAAGGDPILVGRILNPRRGRAAVTFFLAWWLDLRSL